MAPLSKRLELQAAPGVAGHILLVGLEPGGGGIIEDQIDIQFEQINAVPEYLALDGITMLGEQVKRPVQLPEGEIPGFR